MPTQGSLHLSDIEERYCRCLVHVATEGGTTNPYAVCTSSVYNKHSPSKHRSRIPPCSENYNFSKMKRSDLEGYVKLHKVKVPKGLTDKQLAQHLQQYVDEKYGTRTHAFPSKNKVNFREVYIKMYQADHPEIPLGDARKIAGKDYDHVVRKMKEVAF